MGVHTGTNYQDCSIKFQENIETLVHTLSAGCLTVDFPFGILTKLDIAAFCKKKDVPLNLTYSCLQGVIPPCGACFGCQDRKEVISYENTAI